MASLPSARRATIWPSATGGDDGRIIAHIRADRRPSTLRGATDVGQVDLLMRMMPHKYKCPLPDAPQDTAQPATSFARRLARRRRSPP